ncbi:acyl-CoA dehydrogenase family protein [Novosphingobium sp. ZN18A2]|uniref:acyl-CoA dehydrogenase family protein n=1 Tax=Novosphingobium sp. ZN18A2 TaxID=3079861 RepID=UPI0030D4D7BF
MQIFPIRPFNPPGDIPALRQQVRDLVAQHESHWQLESRANCWFSFDEAFSKALGKAGLLAMNWPKEYGGHERTMLERYVVLEELLALGAPAGLHWIADRQTGPLLIRYGTEAQKQKYLPGMARGEIYACIGLSEPNAGSDLASVRTSARKTPEGWRVNGQKVWTSGAHRSHAALTLVRTEEGSERHAGLSQLMIDLDTPGITIRPIVDMTGSHHFNEIFFEDALIPLDALVGTEGNGWKQVVAELALERSGPERYLSSHALLVALIDAVGPEPAPDIAQLIGRLTAELWTLRQMSMSTAAKLDAGEDPVVEAAIVKDLGNAYEQALPRLVQAAVDADLADRTDLSRLLVWLLVQSPSYSLRGGTPEVLRGIIAKGLGLR